MSTEFSNGCLLPDEADQIHVDGEQSYGVTGIGAMLVKANYSGDLQMVLATVLVVTSLNRFFWRRVYDYASDKFTMEY